VHYRAPIIKISIMVASALSKNDYYKTVFNGSPEAIKVPDRDHAAAR
jgi:hypothetical protein